MRNRTLALCLLLTISVAGCGSNGDDGVASAGGSASTSGRGASGEQTEKKSGVEFAQCMRENGMPTFPDPEVGDNGEFRLRLPQGADRDKVDAAQEKCKQHLPGGGEPPKMDRQQVEQLRAYARCMRRSGVPNFPDPSNGGFKINLGELGLEPSDPKLKAAEKACNTHLPKPPSGAPAGGTDSEGNG